MSGSENREKGGQVWLSAKGLKAIPAIDLQPNFTFIVGENDYHCPILVACFLSPRICQARSIDCTVCEFEIKTSDPHAYFSDVLSLGRGEEVELNDEKVAFLQSVGAELGNWELTHRLFCNHKNETGQDTSLSRLAALTSENSISGNDLQFVASHFSDFSISDLASVNIEVLCSILSSPSLVLRNEDSLFEIVRGLASNSDNEDYFRLLEYVHFELLSHSGITAAAQWISECFDRLTKPIWDRIQGRLLQPIDERVASFASRYRFAAVSSRGDPKLDSQIILTFPAIFSTFRAHLFRLLYRGSRDGFGSSAFHNLCDGHSPTLTVILSENGSIFGGYTPVAWHSRGEYVTDKSAKSFVFTLKNPGEADPRIFPVKQDQVGYAIWTGAAYGPIFGAGHDICVLNDCHASTSNYTSGFGKTYVNDTGREGETFLTGGPRFTVREIEVFELST
jgi:hypothetical protein